MSSTTTPPIHGALRGATRVFLAEALAVPTGLLTAGFLTRRLGPGDYGLLTLAATIVAWVEWSVASVLGRTAIKLVSEAKDWRPVGAAVVRLQLILGVAAALLVWLAAEPLAALLDEPGLAWLLRLLAFDIPLFSLAQAHCNILVGRGGFDGRAASVAGRWIVRLLLILAFVGAGLSAAGAALATMGASLAELLICRRYVCPRADAGPRFPARRLWAFAVPLFLAGVTLRLFEKLDLLALKALGGTSEQAGHYAAAQNLALLPAVLSMSLAPVLLSSLGRELRSGDVGAARGLARDALRAVVLLMPLPAIIAGCAPEIIGMIFGPAFAPAATPLALLIFGSSAMLMISVTSAILTAADRAGLALALSVPLVPLAVVGHLVAVPAMGLAGAAVVTLAAASLGALAQLIAVHRQWGIRPAMPTIGRSATAGVFATALALLWPAPGALLLLKLPAAGLAALVVLGALGEFSPGEVAAARALLPGRPIFPRNQA